MSAETLNKIPPPKHGTEFLASTHFKIGHEPQWSVNQDPAAYRSTFKKDYPPQPIEKREKTKLLPPADIMHRDEKIGDDHYSVTRQHYGLKPLSKTGYGNLPYSLTATNFKMDADEKIKSFRTTHNEYFYEKSAKDLQDKSSMKDWTKSHIPQGDREKIRWQESDYKSHFLPITAKNHVQPTGAVEGPPTIKGDIRIHHDTLYNTTMKDCFPSKYKERFHVDEKIRYPSTHIPQGDRAKCNYLQSTQKEDYQPFIGTDESASARSTRLAKLQSTSLKMGDPRLDSFRSTVQDSYQHFPGEGRITTAKKVMNKSHLPEGDSDYLINLERFSSTMHRSQFKTPPSDYRTPKIDGSHLRTLSNVHLGNDQRLNSYETTMDDNFRARKSSFQKALGNVHSSSIPTDFYKDLKTQPTYRADYANREEMTKLEPNPIALNMLKRSNVNITDPSFKEFGTTHKATYTPKQNNRERAIELGKLQKSSVPLGTLSR